MQGRGPSIKPQTGALRSCFRAHVENETRVKAGYLKDLALEFSHESHLLAEGN